MLTKEIRLVRRPDGLVRASDFEMVQRQLPVLSGNQVLVKQLFIGIDPGLRIGLDNGTAERIVPLELGSVMPTLPS